MEVWVMMWMLQYDVGGGKTAYQPRTQEVVGPRSKCEEKARLLRIYYISKGIKYGNVYCVKKEEDE